MTEAQRFLHLAALELIKQEGVHVVKHAPDADGEAAWAPGWEDWDEVLVGDGPGVQPAIYAVRTAASLDGDTAHRMFEGLISRITDNRLVRMGQGYQGSIRVVSIFCFNSIDPATARELAGIVPDRFHPNLKPAVWVVDLSQGKLWAPRTLGIIPTRAQAAVKRAIAETGHGAGEIGDADLARAENIVASEREAFVSTIRRNVPYVTYALLAAIWIVFYFESSYPHGSTNSATLLHFGALQPRLVERGDWWRLFTAMFVHVGIVHILFNSIALYSVGSMVERIYGAARYTIIYFASGLFASVASYAYMVWTGQNGQIAAGASGAIFGVAGVLIILGVLRHTVVPRAMALQLSVYMGVLIVMNIAFDFTNPQIDVRAHIGGLVVGLVLGYFLAPRASSGGSSALAVHGEEYA